MPAIRVKVCCYSNRGFFVNDKESYIEEGHRRLPGMELMQLFRKEDPSTRIYSPWRDGFTEGYFYTVHVFEDGRGRFICNFVIDKRKCAQRETIPGCAY